MADDPKTSRGFRNRNPGNIDYNAANKWLGQLGRETAGDPPRFAVFDSHENGIRAIAGLLTTYQDKYGLDTVRQIINRWAPPVENQTSAYARAVASDMGVGLDEPLTLHQHGPMFGMVKAIIRHELGGVPYTDAEIDTGLARFGIVRPAPTVASAAASPEAKPAVDLAKYAGLATPLAPVLQHFAGLNPWVAALIVLSVVACTALYIVMKRRTDASGAKPQPSLPAPATLVDPGTINAGIPMKPAHV